jgi:hypothetical protein
MKQSDIISVAETPEGVHLLFIDYAIEDPASATGSVYRVPFDRESAAAPLPLLGTGDTLRTLWASPEGHLWVASANGYVGTTAPVDWPPAPKAAYDTMNDTVPWTVTALPRTPHDGLPPNVTHLWGTGDDNVFAAVYGGHIYHWDGVAWKVTHDAGPSPYGKGIRAFGGSGPNDVYAVGVARTLLHWNGEAWRALAVPGTAANEGLTGVVIQPDGSVLISASGNEGRLLQGSAADGFTELCQTPLQLIGMVLVAGRVFIALPGGAAEWVDGQVQMRKDNFQASAIFAGRRRAYFIESTQETPRFVEYSVDIIEQPWWRYSF